jgi:hypothetical protein
MRLRHTWMTYMRQLSKTRISKVVTIKGGARRKPNAITATDTLRMKRQRTMFPTELTACHRSHMGTASSKVRPCNPARGIEHRDRATGAAKPLAI